MIHGSRESLLPRASRVIIECTYLQAFPLLLGGCCNLVLVLHNRVKQLKDQSNAYSMHGLCFTCTSRVEFGAIRSETDLSMLCPVAACLSN